MRVPEQGKKPSDIVQAQLDPEPLETIEVLEGRVVIHRSGRGKGTSRVKGCPIVDWGTERGPYRYIAHGNRSHDASGGAPARTEEPEAPR